MIQVSQLRKLLPDLSNEYLLEWVNAFNPAMQKFEIDTPERQAAFFAQIFHESGGLNHLAENLNYSAEGLLKTFPKYFKKKTDADTYARQPDKIANRVYADRMGNGNELSGDGWKYRGRSPVMITGKQMYQLISIRVFNDKELLLNNPELLKKPNGGAAASCWYWAWKGCNELADKGDFEAITQKINGGLIGQDSRIKWWEACKKVFI